MSRSSTTVAFWMRGSDLLPDGRERMDERRVDRGNIGAVGRIVTGGEGADAPTVHAGTGGGLGGGVFWWGAGGGAAQDGLDARRSGRGPRAPAAAGDPGGGGVGGGVAWRPCWRGC